MEGRGVGGNIIKDAHQIIRRNGTEKDKNRYENVTNKSKIGMRQNAEQRCNVLRNY